MNTKKIAQNVSSRYKTRDPYEIADYLGIIVIVKPLGKLRGFAQNVARCKLVYINENLDEMQQKLVCAHEIGHFIMHKGYNRIFMDSCTFTETGRFETEAHRFSVDLLYDDSDLQQFLGYDMSTVADCLGVSYQLAEYRMSTVEPKFW